VPQGRSIVGRCPPGAAVRRRPGWPGGGAGRAGVDDPGVVAGGEVVFITAVAVGAIVGRTAVASTQSFATGAAALLALIVVHRLASLARLHPTLRKLFDHQVRVLVHHGELRGGQLRHCGLTDDDVFSHLRENGVLDVADVMYLLYEAKGALTIVLRGADGPAPLVQAALERSTGFGP